MFGTRKLIIKGLTAGGRLGPPSIPLGYASLHYERAQPMTLANDLKVFNFRWQSGVQFWVAVHKRAYTIFKSGELSFRKWDQQTGILSGNFRFDCEAPQYDGSVKSVSVSGGNFDVKTGNIL